MKPLTHLDLFSGIGGFALAARWAGLQTIGFSEIEPYACQVLKKHWPDVPNYGDVRTVPAIKCDVISGGFPCQPFSLAGKQKGAADDRHLWPSMFDAIKRCRPAWVLAENVPGIIGMELARVLSDLESADYQSQVFVVPACAVDAPHRRDRVWIVAYSNSNGRETRSVEKRLETPLREIAEGNGEALANSSHSEWLPESGICRVSHGISRRVDRLKALGNAIVPQVAEKFFRWIITTEQSLATA